MSEQIKPRLDEYTPKDFPYLDIERPGPWVLRDYGQNGYEVIDANGATVEHGRDGYDADEDARRENIIKDFNSYVAKVLASSTDADFLSDEFFRRREGLTPTRPIFLAADAKRVAESYRGIGKPHIADAISGVRYGRKMLAEMKSAQNLSREERDKKMFPFREFGMAHAAGYFTLEEIGVTEGELRELLLERDNYDLQITLETIRSGDFADERTQYTQLIYLMDRGGMAFSSFSPEDQVLMHDKFLKYLREE